MTKKGKIKKVKQIKNTDARTPMIFNIPSEVEKDSKIKAKDVFVGYKSEKGKKGKKKK
tara:strand:+ start:134 stop:307 length:174 start_codon:yes stop_codon:yes gene_type:complete